jgi:hypothetical protein
MKKLIWFTTVFILLLVIVAPAILALGINLVPGDNQPGYNPDLRLSIYKDRDVVQKFISQEANLSAIGTSVRNPNLKNKKDIILTLYDDRMNLLRTVTINGQNVEDGSLIKFVFEPITDSKNKTFIFTLASPDASPEETIEVFYSESMPSWIVQFTYDKVVHPGGIPVVLYFKPESKIAVIKAIYSDLFSRLLHPYFRKTS